VKNEAANAKSLSEMNQSIQTLVQISKSGHVSFPAVIIDFSQFKCESEQSKKLALYLEANAKQAWAIAEAAHLHALVNKKTQAFALYITALQLLLKTFKQVKSEITELGVNRNECERLSVGLLWIRAKYADFMERIEDLIKVMPRQIINTSQMNIAQSMATEIAIQQFQMRNSVCVEKVLFMYAVKMAKQAAFEDYMSEDCRIMFARAKIILEYLWYHTDLKNDEQDKTSLEKHIQLITNRMISKKMITK